jgi:hypothetical protein
MRPFEDPMTHHDVTRHQAQLLLTREATLAAHYGRRVEQAVGSGDVVAARRWNREYRLSAFRCRMLGTLLRTSATTTTWPTSATHASAPARPDTSRADHPQHDAHGLRKELRQRAGEVSHGR